jgi:hypothetical protein
VTASELTVHIPAFRCELDGVPEKVDQYLFDKY